MKKVVFNEFSSEQLNIIKRISSNQGITFSIAKLLYARKIDTEEKVSRFLNPGKENFYSPFLMDNLSEGVERIKKAKENGEKVLIFGDYDADGISATVILKKALLEFGIDAFTLIPERNDGYGINQEMILDYVKNYGVSLMITVDCGISDFAKIEELKKAGLDVIVTDHHEPPEILPDCLLINPKIKGNNYPYNGLCGAGVAFKLATGLIGEKANKYLDFVALATVADSMDLLDENRDIVFEGLKVFNSPFLDEGFKALLKENGVTEVTAQTLAYVLAPRINASGRMGDARFALNMFLEKGDLVKKARKLNDYNGLRQQECDNLYKEAKEKLLLEGANKNVIMLYDENWKTGFVGIVAARLTEEYSRPVIMFAGLSGILKGSARSVFGINIFDAIDAQKDILEEYGGHSQAAGVAIKKENFNEFYERVHNYLEEKVSEKFVPTIFVEEEIFKPFSYNFIKELERLEPTGVGNKKPLFLVEEENLYPTRLKAGKHLSFKTQILEMLYFNGEWAINTLRFPVKKKIVFEANVSTFKNKEYVKGFVKAVLPSFARSEEVDVGIFDRSLLPTEEGNFSSKNTLEINEIIKDSVKKKYGTLFVITNVENLKEYPILKDMEINLFALEERNLFNALIVAPESSVFEIGYERVVYLDTPLFVNSSLKEVYVNRELTGLKNIDKISIDRSVFATYFNTLKSLVNKKYLSIEDFIAKNKDSLGVLNPYQLVFVMEVFFELGIFFVEDEVFRFNSKIKSDLNNSKIYSKVRELKND
ncbi:MAG: single-stranded-DNA-specific exonuclease RecJ [Clostridiales bacterium]|nr:single-stranded-DNA-specific exonuclease RecJ [Clostridiales bacterium]